MKTSEELRRKLLSIDGRGYKAYKELEARGLQVVVSRIQEILTVQEQAGFQMIMAILDEDHIDYLNNKRADAPYWTTLGK